MEDFVETPLHELSQFIGDYSQNVCGSSYNEDEVREIWRLSQLNERATHPCYTLDSAWPDAPADFQAEMNRLVKEAGVWALSWRSKPGALSDEEKAMAGLPSVTHGDVLVGLIHAYPTQDQGYFEEVIAQIVYDHWGRRKDEPMDPETLVRAVLEDTRFFPVGDSNAELQKQRQRLRRFQRFSGDMNYKLSSFSVSFTEPQSPASQKFMDEWASLGIKASAETPPNRKH